jgi:hypothetical protein
MTKKYSLLFTSHTEERNFITKDFSLYNTAMQPETSPQISYLTWFNSQDTVTFIELKIM